MNLFPMVAALRCGGDLGKIQGDRQPRAFTNRLRLKHFLDTDASDGRASAASIASKAKKPKPPVSSNNFEERAEKDLSKRLGSRGA